MYGDRYVETPEQKKAFRLLSAIYQTENILKLTEDNPYKTYLHVRLHQIKCELERQKNNNI